MRWMIWLIGAGLAGSPLSAEEPTAVTLPEDALRQAETCLLRLEEITDRLAADEDAAVQSNELARAQCIRRKHAAVAGLLAAMKPIHKRLPLLVDENEPELLQDELDRMLNACTRAETMLTAAQACRDTPEFPAGSAVRRRPRRREGADNRAPVDAPTAGGVPLGLRAKCLRQEHLACLLVSAFEIEETETATPTPCVERLARRGFEPLEGWEGTRCATLADFVVVVAQALELAVEDPEDPASYWQALRDEGLAVELLGGHGPTDTGAGLSEDRARAFLARGYAGPFPSLRP